MSLVAKIQRALSPDLLRGPWAIHTPTHPHAGHCYVASEALYHLLGGKQAGFTPMFVRHENQPHWFLRGPQGKIIDPTAAQFRTRVPYERAVAKGFLTREPSRRARIVLERVR